MQTILSQVSASQKTIKPYLKFLQQAQWKVAFRLLLGGITVTLSAIPHVALANPIPTPTQPNPILSTRGVLNGGFEQPTIVVGPGASVPEGYGFNPPMIWQTTDTSASYANSVETWRGVQTGAGGPTSGANGGQQYVELNGGEAASLYQDICILPNETVNWSLFHTARYSGQTNRMQVSITNPASWVGKTPPATQLYNSGNLTTSYAQGWQQKTGSWVNTVIQIKPLRFAFAAITGSLGNNTLGNFLDDVNLQFSPIIDFAPTDLANNVNLPTTVEGNTTNNYYLTVRINGTLQTNGSVDIDLMGLNAARTFTLGTPLKGAAPLINLTISKSGNKITLNLPAGTYDPNLPAQYIHIPINFSDNTIQSNDNLTFIMSNPQGGGNSVLAIVPLSIVSSACNVNAITTVNATLIDDDAPANLVFVKRITAINSNLINYYEDDTTSIRAADDNSPNWPLPLNSNVVLGNTTISTFLRGKIDAGKVQPSDIIEYTIYFLNTGGYDANNVKLCDRIIDAQQFTGTTIQLQQNNAAPTTLTSAADADRATFFSVSSSTAAGCNFKSTPATDNGAVVVNVTGASGSPTWTTLAGSTGPGTTNSYGFVRFTTKVNP